MKIDQFKVLHTYIMEALRGTKYPTHTFYVGECVRNLYLNIDNIKSVDLVVNLDSNEAIKVAELITRKLDCYQPGKNPQEFPIFGKATFNLKRKFPSLGDVKLSVSMTRKEPKPDASGRKPIAMFGSLEEDAMRREFTANALYIGLQSNKYYDYTRLSLYDLKHHIIRATSSVELDKNPMLIMKLIRYACDLDWGINANTWVDMCRNAYQIASIPSVTIRDELNRIILTQNPAEGIRRLINCGLMTYIMPEIVMMKGMGQSKQHNQDVLEHSLSVMSKTKPILVNRMAGLLHDVGKILTYDRDVFGKVHFKNHETVGAEAASGMLRFLEYPEELIDKVEKAIKLHMRFKNANLPSKHSLRKFLGEAKDDVELCLDVINADNNSHLPYYNKPKQVNDIKNMITRLKKKDEEEENKIKLPVNGKELMEKFNLNKGPIIGQMLKILNEHINISPKMTKEEAFSIISEAIAKKQI